MKQTLSLMAILLVTLFTISSCSKNDDPVNNDFFVGTYTGTISYDGPSNDVASTQGTVTVTKIASGTKYNFHFSNSIPDITNVEFEKKGDNIYFNIGGQDGVNYIRIDASTLKMLYIKDGATWTANCSR
ncbi:MAG: hypothetical protein BGN92_11165 [Sphingobacteriales bacterium 41-5]|nr:MAG: hypothetical protein BGN92_11165 [Sphingobacteriales bacterium 41-5]